MTSFEYLIKTYSDEFDFIFDPYTKNTTTLIAYNNTNKNCIGYENNEPLFKKAKERIDNHITNKYF